MFSLRRHSLPSYFHIPRSPLVVSPARQTETVSRAMPHSTNLVLCEHCNTVVTRQVQLAHLRQARQSSSTTQTATARSATARTDSADRQPARKRAKTAQEATGDALFHESPQPPAALAADAHTTQNGQPQSHLKMFPCLCLLSVRNELKRQRESVGDGPLFESWQPPGDPDVAYDIPPPSPCSSFAVPALRQSPPILSHAAEVAAASASTPTRVSSPPRLVPSPALDTAAFTGSSGLWLANPLGLPQSLAPRDFIASVHNVQVATTAAASAAVPLTKHVAHTLPKPTGLERRITRQMTRMYEQAEREMRENERAASSAEADPVPATDDSFADVDGGITADTFFEEDPPEVPPDRPTSSRAPPQPPPSRPPFVYKPFTTTDAENDVDEFHPAEDPDKLPASPIEFAAAQMDHVEVSIYAVVQWLSSMQHLPRLACNTLLRVFGLVVFFLGFSELSARLAKTLPTVSRRLGTDPEVVCLPVCPTCNAVFPHTTKHTRCPSCDVDLFRASKCPGRIPARKYPYYPLRDQIRSILLQPGLEEAADAWRSVQRNDGKLRDVFDGDVARNIVDHKGGKFFRNDPGDEHGPDGELRLAVTFGLDWSVPHQPR